LFCNGEAAAGGESEHFLGFDEEGRRLDLLVLGGRACVNLTCLSVFLYI
jgi:hypothetical protein